MEQPETRYARSGDVSIAYQVTGAEPFDLVHVPGFVSHVELSWQVRGQAEFARRLASFSRLIRFDKRGQGMSDRVSAATLETRMDDVRAVMDAVGSERAALLGTSEGGPLSVLFAATYPDRVWALVLAGSYARVLWAPDYLCGNREDESREYIDRVERNWGSAEHATRAAQRLAPSADEEGQRALATLMRQSASPGSAAAYARMNMEIDVRHVLSAIRVPTLVLNRSGDASDIVGGSRYLAEHIPGARHVELPGTDHAIFAGDPDSYLEQIERFVSEVWEERAWEEAEPERVLATVLFTDIVGSTAKAAELGDARWRDLIQAHHALIRRQLVRFRGTELDTAGDGLRFLRRSGARDPLRVRDHPGRARARHRGSGRSPHRRVRAHRPQGRWDRGEHRCARCGRGRRRRGARVEHRQGSRRRLGDRVSRSRRRRA